MNVGSSAPSTSATATAQPTQSSSVKPQDKAATSFEEEMKNVNAENSNEQEVQKKTDSKTQNKEASADEQQGQNVAKEDSNVITGKVEEVEVDAKLDSANLLSLNIQQLLDTQTQITNKAEIFEARISRTEDLTKNIGETLSFQSVQMSENDAQFFVDLVKNNNAGVQNVVQDVQQALTYGTEEVQKSANVSKTLLNALANTQKTGQAVRIDFGNDIAVVMRVSKDGSIMANFIPGDKAVEEYLKNNIGFLRQRFEEEDIPYSRLSYSQHEGQEQRQRQENNKEDKHE